ncbi:OLC1v1033929C3 [Oldenlandia corymbosa var. corymbosa]|uniref:OLC1v1033929C3 n=1 Tax=Oldenlandia corymbosa var. corymbosa TaxID=529605 RepID=A0AAV1CP92_OLDCO|nr:OLC1v1033929C3 [Oldenlandia corymbosa var. corymbosa]
MERASTSSSVTKTTQRRRKIPQKSLHSLHFARRRRRGKTQLKKAIFFFFFKQMYKSKLQELCHKRSWNLPVYVTQKDGPDHCPAFTTTVTINEFEFASEKNGSKSSKDAQNAAAKLAYDFLSSLPADQPPHPSHLYRAPSPPSPSVPSAPSRASGSNVVSGAPQNGALHQNHLGNLDILLRHNNNASVNKGATEPVKKDVLEQHEGVNIQGSTPKDLLHVYKNQLQHYAQKNNISLPAYSNEFVGLPHVRRFKASVVVDGITYQCPEYYSTLRDAEHAAAKVALEALSIAEIPENEGLSKSLLQELAQKMGFRIPSYSTVRSGPSHKPTFVSTVEVGGVSYEGVGCKTKKQSEMSAAKVAYEKLTSGNAVSHCSPASTLRINAEASCPGLQLANVNACQVIGAQNTSKNHMKRAPGEMNAHPGVLSCGTAGKEFSSPHSGSNTLQNILPTLAPTVKEAKMDEVEGEGKAKRHKRSSSENISHHLPEAIPPSDLSIDPSSGSLPSESVKSEEARRTEGGNPLNSKTLIFRRGSNMEIPEGAIELSLGNDEWVVMRVPLDQDQQAGTGQ